MTDRALTDLERVALRDPWLTEKEAAKELRVSPYVVRQERLAGRLQFARLRRRVFYPLSLINAYKVSLICQEKSNSGSIQAAGVGTSHGPMAGARIALQRAQQIVARQKKSERLSS